jgi:hypothetical protein
MTKRFLTVLLCSMSVLNAQGVWTGWTSNGKQSCTAVPGPICETPWATGWASCQAPFLGPSGYRWVGGQVAQQEFCMGGTAYAVIVNNLPWNYTVSWSTDVYDVIGSLAQHWDAYSACDEPDSDSDYASAKGENLTYYGGLNCL